VYIPKIRKNIFFLFLSLLLFTVISFLSRKFTSNSLRFFRVAREMPEKYFYRAVLVLASPSQQ